MEKKLFSKQVIGWFFYDWVTSTFSTVVTTFIFATYFTKKVALNKITGTSQWGDAISFAALIIVITSPIVGAIADFEGRRKPWLGIFTFFMILGSGMFWFVKPDHYYISIALAAVVIGLIGSEVAMVFYNSMLRDLVPENYIGRMSGWAWGFGYFGGLIALVICLFLFISKTSYLHLDRSTYEQVRIIGPFISLWILVFSLPLFILTPDRKKFGVSVGTAVKKGLKQLLKTIQSVRRFRNIFKFLIARMIYIDGLNTMFAFGGIYAAGAFNMGINEVIIFGITLHLGAGIGAVAFAWLDDWVGPKPTVLLAIFITLASGTIIVFTHAVLIFWSVGFILSMCVGPIQAASRSFMIQISPKEIITELFGLYALSGRATAFVGPWILGEFTLHFNSQRVGMSTILAFLFLGGLLLLFVKGPQRTRSRSFQKV